MGGKDEKTKTLPEAGTLISEKRAMWCTSSKESRKRKEDHLAMSEELKQYVGEAEKAREAWLAINSEAGVILEETRLQED